MFCVHPELVHQIEAADTDNNLHRRTRQIHRQIENKTNVVGTGLPQRGAEVVLLALMMSRVRRPHDAPLMPKTVFPVVAKVIPDKGQGPLPPMISRPLGNAK